MKAFASQKGPGKGLPASGFAPETRESPEFPRAPRSSRPSPRPRSSVLYFAAAQIQMRANADNNEAGDPKNIYDNVVFNIACVRRAHIVSPIAAPAADSAGAAGEAY